MDKDVWERKTKGPKQEERNPNKTRIKKRKGTGEQKGCRSTPDFSISAGKLENPSFQSGFQVLLGKLEKPHQPSNMSAVCINRICNLYCVFSAHSARTQITDQALFVSLLRGD